MINRFFVFLICFMGIAFAADANAQDIKFIPPVNCDIGQDCWIVNYFDHDEIDGVLDYACGVRGYDAHDGTDFGVADILRMEQGVDVVAAADGRILRIRDGMEDLGLSDEERQELFDTQKGCGNGVVIDHGAGWQSIYCHLKKDSIAVEQGQKVKAGEKLADIGHSGFAHFPHVHFGVIFEGKLIDPFVGLNASDGCGGDTNVSLWADDIALNYSPMDIYAVGFSKNVPDTEALKIDAASLENMNFNDEAIVFWSAIYGVMAGDKIDLSIIAPDGRVFVENQITQDANRARQFYYIGKKRPAGGFQKGTYIGEITVMRGSDVPVKAEKQTRIAVD